MKEELNENQVAVEIFEEDTIITLYDEEENPIDFFEIASVELDGKFYEILQPVEAVEGVEDDEAVIFEYELDPKTSDKMFKPVFEEELLNEIFEMYLKAAADYESDCDDHCGCGCEYEDCDCEEDCDDEGCGCGCGCGHKDE